MDSYFDGDNFFYCCLEENQINLQMEQSKHIFKQFCLKIHLLKPPVCSASATKLNTCVVQQS